MRSKASSKTILSEQDTSTKYSSNRITAQGSSFETFTVFISIGLLAVFGIIRDFFGRLTGISRFKDVLTPTPVDVKDLSKGFFPDLTNRTFSFFIRRILSRFDFAMNVPLCSQPGSRIMILPRENDSRKKYSVPQKYLDSEVQKQAIADGTIKSFVNLCSYNYLGFADDWKETCSEEVFKSLEELGPLATSTYLEAGRNVKHDLLEQKVSSFLGKEDACVFGMGYGTNTAVLTSLLCPGSVVVSDSLNHASIVNGCRGGDNVKIVPFDHNDLAHLEEILQSLILCGQHFPEIEGEDQTHAPWKKILIVVEGIYSMEGESCDLKAVVVLAKKYKSYVYLDEAHSIGASGNTGRGICESQGVPLEDVDVHMGTFSKSFGGMGGYVASDKDVVRKLRAACDGTTTMSPLSSLVTSQVMTAFNYLATPPGLEKIRKLKENANYFRKKLLQMGCKVLGEKDSPVIPMMIYTPAKGIVFCKNLRKKGIAIVLVSYPAVPLTEGRARFCISSAHTRKDLRRTVREIYNESRDLGMRYMKEC